MLRLRKGHNSSMSQSNYKPEAHQDAVPYLVVHNASKLCDFVKAAFGAQELERHVTPDGYIMHSEFRIGDSVICIADSKPEWAPRVASIMLYVQDPDATYANAVAAGATTTYDLEDKDYGMRSAGIEDPAGNHWYISTLLSSLKR